MKRKAPGGEEGSAAPALDDQRVLMCRMMFQRLDEKVLPGRCQQASDKQVSERMSPGKDQNSLLFE